MSDELRKAFREEVSELIEEAENALLTLHQHDYSAERVNDLFRTIHSIKGSCRMFGYEEVEDFLHHFEDLLDSFRTNVVQPDNNHVSMMLEGIDELRLLINDQKAAKDRTSVRQALMSYYADTALEIDNTSTESASVNAEPESDDCLEIYVDYKKGTSVSDVDWIPILEDLLDEGVTAIQVAEKDIPDFEKLDPKKASLPLTLIAPANADRKALEDCFLFVDDMLSVTFRMVKNESNSSKEDKSDAKSAPKSKEKEGSGSVQETIRVRSHKLDELLNLLGELVISQSQLGTLAQFTKDLNFQSAVENNERLISSLRESVFGIRMISVESLFHRLERQVFDLNRELGKEVTLVTDGENNELDKGMLEQLYEPMTHLIRNAIDHGIETAEERSEVGKDRRGLIKVSARQEHGEFVLRVDDDGKGLNLENIADKAIQKQIIPKEHSLSEEEIAQLIFHPGFSTSSKVTHISGRGVGLDVVRETIEGMRGRVEVKTKEGEGTTFWLRLPQTLSIIECLHVKSGPQSYAIPLTMVERCDFYSKQKGIERERPLFKYREGVFAPWLNLAELMHGEATGEEKKMIVINAHGDVYGIVVDEIIGTLQSVVKPLDAMFKNVQMVSSGTILGDGKVGLILDTRALLERSKKIEEKYLSQNEEERYHGSSELN